MELYGIIGAMDSEIIVLCNSMENKNITMLNNFEFISGMINSTQVVVVKSGIGKVNAAICALTLITAFNVTSVINTGIAGAINHELHVFDFVVSTDAAYHDVDVTAFGYPKCTLPKMPTYFEASTSLIQKTITAFKNTDMSGKIYTGRIATGDQFISNIEQKNLIRETCNPYCVEMEGAAIAHTCFLLKVPFVIIRCISDMADEATDLFDEKQAARLSSNIVLHLLK